MVQTTERTSEQHEEWLSKEALCSGCSPPTKKYSHNFLYAMCIL